MRQFINIVENANNSLPMAGQVPFWVGPLKPLTKRIKGNWGNRWTWTEGGCFAFAEIFHEVYGGEFWGVCSDPDGEDDYAVEHAMVKVNGLFYDFTGVVDVEKYMKKLSKENGRELKLLPRHEAFWFEDEYLDDDDLEYLRDVLTGKELS